MQICTQCFFFSANNVVTATGMKVNAVAESGIVISNAANGTYSYTAATTTAQQQLKPASTANFTTWYHSTSNDPANALNIGGVAQAYEEINATNHYEISEYRVMYSFFIRSSSPTALSSTKLKINSVTAERSAGDQDLSKALRVGVLIEGDTNPYIYAPVTGFTATYSVQGTTSVTAKASNVVTESTVQNIPANSANGLECQIFVWFEGEDASCKSSNLVASLETLTVQVEFGY